MDTLWRENRPLTTLQLAEKITEASWNTNYIDKLLGQLVKKGMVQVSGLLQNGRYQSRQFVPLLHQGRIFWRTCSRSKA